MNVRGDGYDLLLQHLDALLGCISDMVKEKAFSDVVLLSAQTATAALMLLRKHLEADVPEQPKPSMECTLQAFQNPAATKDESTSSEGRGTSSDPDTEFIARKKPSLESACLSMDNNDDWLNEPSPGFCVRQASNETPPRHATLSPSTCLRRSVKKSGTLTPDVGSKRASVLFEEDGLQTRQPSFNSSIGYMVRQHRCFTQGQCYIDPNRPFRITWDFCSMAFILLLVIIIPYEMSFLWETEYTPGSFLHVINTFADLWFGVDIALNCFTAFYKGKGTKSRLVKHPALIIRNYARGWLWIDLLATFPIAPIMQTVAGWSTEGTSARGMFRALKIAKVARMLKVLRALKLGGLMQIVEEQLVAAQSMTVAFQLMKLSAVMLLISHCAACAWFAVGHWGLAAGYSTTWLIEKAMVEEPEWDRWVASFYFAITTGTTVGYGDISATNTMERVVGTCFLVLAVAYIGHFLARVGQVVSSLQQGEAEMMKVKRCAMLFMRRRNVPKELYQKVLRYIEHVWGSDSLTSLDQTQFLETLSESLQLELRLAVTGTFLKMFPLFSEVEDTFIKAICPVCRTRRAGVGDVVAEMGQANDEMYMIVRGEAVFFDARKNLGILCVEDWFGERALFFEGVVHTVSIRCETDCEFLILSRSDFVAQVRKFPKVRQEYDLIVDELSMESRLTLRKFQQA